MYLNILHCRGMSQSIRHQNSTALCRKFICTTPWLTAKNYNTDKMAALHRSNSASLLHEAASWFHGATTHRTCSTLTTTIQAWRNIQLRIVSTVTPGNVSALGVAKSWELPAVEQASHWLVELVTSAMKTGSLNWYRWLTWIVVGD